jgi:inner membrane protein
MVTALYDLVYFVDRSRPHHDYWSHTPSYWVVISIVALVALRRASPFVRSATIVLLANVLGHFILDTWVGGIRWLFPFSEAYVRIVEVPARFEHWIWNFVLHWTFLPDLALVGGALALIRQRRRGRAYRSGTKSIAVRPIPDPLRR